MEQVAVLLHRIMADNPKLASLYTTGVFFFILMYTGSNLLPIGRFLAMSHDKQAFRSQSILLPFPFVHFGKFLEGQVSYGWKLEMLDAVLTGPFLWSDVVF